MEKTKFGIFLLLISPIFLIVAEKGIIDVPATFSWGMSVLMLSFIMAPLDTFYATLYAALYILACVIWVTGYAFVWWGRKEFGQKHTFFVTFASWLVPLVPAYWLFNFIMLKLDITLPVFVLSISTGLMIFFCYLVSFLFVYNLLNPIGKIILWIMLLIGIPWATYFAIKPFVSFDTLVSLGRIFKYLLWISTSLFVIAYLIALKRIIKRELPTI
jgi:hypothetical protein